MNTSSRFTVAIHLLVALAIRGKVKSDDLAWSVNTNPVVIRRLLRELREAGLVHSQTGPHGGSILTRPAEEITLGHVYDAVETGPLFHPHYSNPAEACPIGSNIENCMGDIRSEAREAVREVLARRTIGQLADDILERSGAKALLASGLTPDEIMERYELENGRFVAHSAIV